ncbi:MAG: GNAT family N-acetyltransferase [Thermomicrobiales bacterium]
MIGKSRSRGVEESRRSRHPRPETQTPSPHHPITPSPPPEVVVRPPATDGEIAAFFQLASTTFIRDAPPATAAADFRRFVHDAPGADPAAVRGAFHGDTYLGGYLIEERWLHIGPARLRTGCVGVVVVHPEHRGQGIGKALMRDAFAHAQARGQALLLLHGLADFYTPFGFADVFDATEHAVQRADILTSAASPYRVRPATVNDAPALLDLYDRHYGPHPGSFARTVAQETFLLRFSASLDGDAYRQRDGLPFEPPIVAVDGDDRSRGYLIAPWGPLRAFGSEVAADDWPATLALLQHHARLFDEFNVPVNEVRWPLPPDSLTASLLADNFLVECSATSRPWANWEGCLVDRLALMRGMLPAWTERWLRHASPWSGKLVLIIDGVCGVVDLSPDGVTFAQEGEETDYAVSLTGRVIVPLLFGFRSVAWAAIQDGQRIPPALLPVLEILFPPVTPWIAPTDGC